MDRTTFERALHMWPDWSASVEKSRRDLGFDVKWPVESRLDWIENNYPKVRQHAQRELGRLQLPSNLFQYWEDCFYCDYRDNEGRLQLDRISRRMGFVDQTTGKFAPGNRSLPPLPFEQAVVWHEDEDVNRPWLRLEISLHPSFFTRTMLDEAAKRAYTTLADVVRLRGYQEHSVSQIINKAKLYPQQRKREALRRYNQGEIDFEGLLKEEWRSEETQERFSQLHTLHERWPLRLAKEERYLKNAVYNRVATWFKSEGLTVPRLRQKGRWWRQ